MSDNLKDQKSPVIKQSNIFFIDIETTGLYNRKLKGYPSILSFGACAHDLREFRVPIIRPNIKNYVIEKEAQGIHGITREDVEGCKERKKFEYVWRDFIQWTDHYDTKEIFLVAYNGIEFDFLMIMHTLFGSRGKNKKRIYFMDTYFDLRTAYPSFCAKKDEIITKMHKHSGAIQGHNAMRDCKALKKIFDQLVYLIPFHYIEFRDFFWIKRAGMEAFFDVIGSAMEEIHLFNKECCYAQKAKVKSFYFDENNKINIDQVNCRICSKSPYERQQIKTGKEKRLVMTEVIDTFIEIKENKITNMKKVKLNE